MRSTIIPFILCLTMWAVAVPNLGPQLSVNAESSVAPGRLLTVRVEGAPANTEFASFDLTPQVRGLQLFRVDENTWEGSFAVLPSMAGEIFRPEAKLFDAEHQAISVTGKGMSIQVSSSTGNDQGMIAETPDGRTAVAFDAKIRLDTIEVRTADEGGTFEPELKNNYVLLPSNIDADEIVSVSAQNLEGEPVVLGASPAAALVIAP